MMAGSDDEPVLLYAAAVDVAVGFATHSGWAIAVAVGLVDDHLQVYDRRRVELVAPDLPRQAYHAVADLPIEEARRIVARVDASILARSVDALSVIGEALGDHTVAAVGMVGPPRDIPDVETVLASHALMHASEGEQYRRAIAQAAAQLGLPVRRTDPRHLTSLVADTLSWSPDRLAAEQTQIRTTLGPPWQRDHKQATTSALLALVALHST
jgi:hypothetical protein